MQGAGFEKLRKSLPYIIWSEKGVAVVGIQPLPKDSVVAIKFPDAQ